MNSARFCFFAVALLGIFGCGRTEPVHKVSRPVIHDKVIHDEVSRPLPVASRLPEDSGITAWADRFEGKLIAGLDGSLYMPYRRATIERVQKALIDRGLYTGPANGVLDRPTMKSIYQFQEANFNLQRCGIPTPRTRNMLQQGSHTDLNS